MQKVDDAKYITFKRNEFYEMMGRLALPPYTGETSTGRVERAGAHWNCAPIADAIKEAAESTCLHDAVVIRRQDVFAAPALEAYANAMQCVIELAKGSSIDGTSIAALQEIADYFHSQATKSYETPDRKIPSV